MEDRNFIHRDVSNIWYEKTRIECINKGYTFTLTIDDVADLMESQSFQCYYTGQELVHGRISKSSYYEGKLTLIHIDNGYIPNNVRFISKKAHIMKQLMGETEFLTLCQNIGSKL
jgi:hypothetical protein